MTRDSFATSMGPSPVRGFIAAMFSLICLVASSRSRPYYRRPSGSNVSHQQVRAASTGRIPAPKAPARRTRPTADAPRRRQQSDVRQGRPPSSCVQLGARRPSTSSTCAGA
jgi:hypothetical protein